MGVIGTRLKKARTQSGLSQEQLGIRAGLDEASASARMNRYERGTRSPSLDLIRRIAQVLDFPATYFYAEDEDEAALLLAFHSLSEEGKQSVLNAAQLMANIDRDS